jgi:hypothetical protein
MLVILATWNAEIGRITVLGQPGQEVCDPISKIIRAKWTGYMAQVVKHLLSKHEALSLNPVPPKKKKLKGLKKNTQ